MYICITELSANRYSQETRSWNSEYTDRVHDNLPRADHKEKEKVDR